MRKHLLRCEHADAVSPFQPLPSALPLRIGIRSPTNMPTRSSQPCDKAQNTNPQTHAQYLSCTLQQSRRYCPKVKTAERRIQTASLDHFQDHHGQPHPHVAETQTPHTKRSAGSRSRSRQSRPAQIQSFPSWDGWRKPRNSGTIPGRGRRSGGRGVSRHRARDSCICS
jgi:hypothetical protein